MRASNKTKPAAAEIIELTVEQLGEVGGGVAYVLSVVPIRIDRVAAPVRSRDEQRELIVEEVIDASHPKLAPAELIELTVEQLGEVGGGVAYVLM